MARKYPKPNVLDPLSEGAPNRRVWAAYLRQGLDRGSFAVAMDVRYNLVTYWDTGKHSMSLAHFAKAAAIVGYTMDELMHGHAGSARLRQPEQPLSADAIRALLLELRANTVQITALAEHRGSPAGELQPMTRTYVTRFVSAYQTLIDAGKSPAHAQRLAMIEAVNAREAVAAADAGRKPLRAGAVASAGAGAGTDGGTRPPRKARKRTLRVQVERPDGTQH